MTLPPPTRPYPYIRVGERVTLTLTSGMPLYGDLLDIHRAADGRLLALLVKPDADTAPVAVNADHIALWRPGDPATAQPWRLAVWSSQTQIVGPADGRPPD